jgi:hypothetical protein
MYILSEHEGSGTFVRVLTQEYNDAGEHSGHGIF